MKTEINSPVERPDTAACLNELTKLLLDQSDFTNAEPLCRRAVKSVKAHSITSIQIWSPASTILHFRCMGKATRQAQNLYFTAR